MNLQEGINVLSLFDGMSCGQIALERAGIKVNNYYACEIDKHAIAVTMANYPNTIQLGDVTKVFGMMLPKIDLLIGGSPCQGFSFIGKMLNFDDDRSRLFFEYDRIRKELTEDNPDLKFLLENVRMKEESKNIITQHLGVEPVFICSSNFSAAKRKRFYWTNICELQEYKETKSGVLLKDILEVEGIHVVKQHGEYSYRGDKANCTDKNYFKGSDNHGQRSQLVDPKRYLTQAEEERARRKHTGGVWRTGTKNGNVNFPTSPDGKAKSILKTCIIGDRSLNHIADSKGIRILTPLECERLQTVPEGYTSSASNSQRYQMLGNGWTVDVIVHIFNYLHYSSLF